VRRRPLIGVTGPDRGGLVAWWMTALALLRGGARPLRVTPSRPADPSRLDGVVIGGGSDVDPFHYGEESEPRPDLRRYSALDWLVGLLLGLFRPLFAAHTRGDYDPDRDRLEQGIIRHALYQGLPVLGICRGAQLMNVVLGGTLHQHIGHFYTEGTRNVRSVLPRKAVNVAADSHLHGIVGVRFCFVNALHNQSVDRLGERIAVSARETNGIVQAIEKSDHPFFIGVQWHPEYMPQSPIQQGLFRGLVAQARRLRAARLAGR